MDEPPHNDVFSLDEFRTLRRENPRALLRHLDELKQKFVFGVEDCRDDESGWGGDARVLVNRNLSVHLVPAFTPDMPSIKELPQFCVMPNEDRTDQVDTTSIDVDGDEVRGAVFYVDPYDYDVYMREAIQIAEEYEDWDAIPDSYYLGTELIRFIGRTILDEPVVNAEREFDFRMPFVGGTAPPPIDEDDYTAEELIEKERSEEDEGDEPLEGMRSINL